MTKIRVTSRKSAAVNGGLAGNRGANGNQFNVCDYLPLMKNISGNPDDYIDSQVSPRFVKSFKECMQIDGSTLLFMTFRII